MMAVPEQPLVPGPMGGPLEWMEGMAYGGLEGEEGGNASAEEGDEEGDRSLVPYAGRGRDSRSRVRSRLTTPRAADHAAQWLRLLGSRIIDKQIQASVLE